MTNKPIAIIGMACRFPGANNYREFWTNLAAGVNSIQEIPPQRWNVNNYYSPLIEQPNKSISKWCGLVDNIEQFDHRFFAISPREAKHIDPQQRLLLEEAWHCLEDAGVPLQQLQTRTTAVYVGVMANDYHQEAVNPKILTDSYSTLGNYESILANRISYTFDFKGESLAINAACASSMVALQQAKTSLLAGTCDYAMVAGVSLNTHPWKYISFSKARMLSPDGQCKTFDKDANGYVPGDGIGVLLLQPLEAALAAGHHVYGIIRGSAANHGGQALSITAPRVEAQRQVIVAALQDANVSPATLTYIEAHGTGTSLGDPIEIEALNQAFREYTPEHHFCAIGSVKTNIGHLEAAAGIAGIIKVLLMMQHQQIPPSINLRTLNPVINFAESPLVVATELQSWTSRNHLPLRAGVSSFGFGGANSHVILEQWLPTPPEATDTRTLPNSDSSTNLLVLLSAKSAPALHNTLAEWQKFINTPEFSEYHLSDICATLMTGRSHFSYRCGRYVKDKDDLTAFFQAAPTFTATSGSTDWGLHLGDQQWDGFATVQSVFAQEPLLNQHLSAVLTALAALDDPEKTITAGFHRTPWETDRQPLYTFMVNYAYWSALRQLGVAPTLISGETTGLWLSLTLSGMMTLEDALAVLSTQKTLAQVQLARPQLPFYDPVNRQTHHFYQLDANYLQRLIDDLTLLPAEAHYVVEQARVLKDCQFTFKKSLAEWETLLRQQANLELEAMLENEKYTNTAKIDSKEAILLLVIINTCLRQLDQKWALTRQPRINDPKFQELLALVSDGIISKQTLIELFTQSKQSEWTGIATSLNQLQLAQKPRHTYPFLTTYSHQQVTIADFRTWLPTAMTTDFTPPVRQPENYLIYGHVKSPNIPAASRHLTLTEVPEHTFAEELLQLWLAGVEINWELLHPEGSFKKVPLPTYGFDRSPFWLPKEKHGPATSARPQRIEALASPERVEALASDAGEEALIGDAGEEALGGTSEISAGKITPPELYNLPLWQPQPLTVSPSQTMATLTAPVIIFADNQGVGEAFAKQFSTSPMVVRMGRRYSHIAPNIYEIDVSELSHYRQLLEQIPSPAKIYFFWGIVAVQETPTSITAFDTLENNLILALFRLAKILSEHHTPLELIIVTRHLHTVIPQDTPKFPYSAPLLGIAKVLGLENPAISIRCIDIDTEETATNLTWLLQDTGPVPFFKEIAYRGGQRYIKTLVSTPWLPTHSPMVVFKPNGVYLIIGGLGGIGLALSQFLVKQFQAKLILVGRSILTKSKQQQLKTLHDLGGEVLYLTADLANWEDMLRVLHTAKQHFGAIQGVIHSALIMAGGLLSNMSEDLFRQALAPKFKGSFILQQMTAREPLDFTLFFSSIITFTGDVGACNYTAGCAFQDSYAPYLQATQQRPIITINWGRWGEVGVTANSRFREVKNLDIDVLTTQEGITSLPAVLASGQAQVVVAKLGGKWLTQSSASDPLVTTDSPLVKQLETEILQQRLNQDLELGLTEVEHYGYLLLLHGFQTWHLFQTVDTHYTHSQVKTHLGVLDKYDRLLAVLLNILERRGILRTQAPGHWIVTNQINQPQLQQQLLELDAVKARLIQAFPDKTAHVNLLAAGLTFLPDILTGRVKATELLFPNSSVALVEGFYRNNRFADYYNHLVAKYLRYEINQRLQSEVTSAKIRILEIGAGTGGTSVKVLEQIARFASHLEYCYTDISMAFVKYGKKHLGQVYPFTRFATLNIETVTAKEQAELGHFDIIFATNVVHATKNMDHTLREIKQFLKPGGCLLLNELTAVQDFLTLTFGLLDGWWLFEDAHRRLPHSPLLGPSQWQTLYAQQGFTNISVFGNPSQTLSNQKQCLVVGYNNMLPKHKMPTVATVRPHCAPTISREKTPLPQERQRLLNLITTLVAKALEVPVSELGLEERFSELGVDSILGVELVNEINRELQQQLLSTTTIYDYPSIRELSEYLFNQLSALDLDGNGAATTSLFGTKDNTSSKDVIPSASRELPKPPVNSAWMVEPAATPHTSLSANPAERHRLLNLVTALVAKAVEMPVSELRLDERFSELGVDSILGVELVNEINRELQQQLLSTTAIYDYPSIQELSEYLFGQLSAQDLDDSRVAQDRAGSESLPAKASRKASESLPATASTKASETSLFAVPSQLSTVHSPQTTEVAIIGMAGQFPGARNVEEFWTRLAQGHNAISAIPTNRWDLRQYLDSEFIATHPHYCQQGGFLTDIDQFDPLFFNISPKEAELMDPQQRLFLQYSWTAMEDAGYSNQSLSNQKVGVYAGLKYSDYFNKILDHQHPLDAHVFMGNDSAILAARIAYLLNLKGPALAIDTACSSSLVAIHLASQQIRTGQIEMAIAGGVLVMTTPQLYTMALHTNMLSPDGQCKTFDNAANGFVPAEGVGVVILKSLEKAKADGDHIYGVIKSSSINQDGKTNGITAPSSLSQTQLELEVYQQANLSPDTISYVEAHGTGTKLGDPIEVEALTNAFRKYTHRRQFCALGAVKSNIGHTMFAAGVAGVIKVLLSLQHKQIPPSLNFHRPNEHINFVDSPFYVPTSLQEWQVAPGSKRRAAVSAFGFSGTNAHLVIEEYVPPPSSTVLNFEGLGQRGNDSTFLNYEGLEKLPRYEEAPQLIVLSARNAERLKTYAQKLLAFLTPTPPAARSTQAEEPLRLEITQYLLETVSAILKVRDQDLSLDDALTDYGLDPVNIATLCQRLQDKYQLEITAAVLSEYPSLSDLAQYLSKRMMPPSPSQSSLETVLPSPVEDVGRPSLANLAYTLQVGRSAMEERLALLVTSLEDLIAKLARYGQGQVDLLGTGYYQGNVKKAPKATTGLLLEGKSGEAFLKVVMAERELDKLAQLWVAGIDIDWQLLYANQPQRPQRISLPTYPFAEERYWLVASQKTLPMDDRSFPKLPKFGKTQPQLHPCLGSNTSTLQAQRFTTLFTGTEFFLADHIIAGQMVLPGVAYLEMARVAGQLAGNRPVRKLTHITWLRPFVLTHPAVAQPINITLHPNKQGGVDYEVTTSNTSEPLVHMQGKLRYDEVKTTDSTQPPEWIDIATLRARCTQVLTTTELYATLKRFGAALGKSFQVIQDWFGNASESLAVLQLPTHLQAGREDFWLHPSLLDGALQTASVGLFSTSQGAYVPFALGELEILQPLPSRCYVQVTEATKARPVGVERSELKQFNLKIADESGRVLVRIKDFSFRAFTAPKGLDGRVEESLPTPRELDHGRVSRTKELDTAPLKLDTPQVMYYRNVWETTVPFAAATGYLHAAGPILFFDTDASRYALVQQQLGGSVILVQPADQYQEEGPYRYSIHPNRPADYRQLLTALYQHHQALPNYIVHLWSQAPFVTEATALEAQLELSFYSLFHLTQALLEQKPTAKIQLLYLYLDSPATLQPQYAAISGLAKTVARENSKLVYKTIALPDFAELGRVLLTEFQTLDGLEIRYQDRQRWVNRWQELNWPNDDSRFPKPSRFSKTPPPIGPTSPLREHGVYLITGGAGGLGFLFAEYLARQVKAKLVLAGRSPSLTSEQTAKLQKLTELGATVVYLQADVTKPQDVEALITQTKGRFHQIHGIIHAAGIIRDALLLKKSPAEIATVLAPKVFGTLYLDEATQTEPLDFFVLFSGVAAIVGNVGQCDYAYANRFMDNFAYWREEQRRAQQRFGKTLSINWPLWQGGGMQVDAQTEKWFAQTIGMTALSPSAGLTTFTNGLAFAPAGQLMVIEGSPHKIKQQLEMATEVDSHSSSAETVVRLSPLTSHDSQEENQFHPQLQSDVLNIVAGILKINVKDLDVNDNIGDYGFDSISFTDLANRLNDQYQLELTPAIFFEYPSVVTLVQFLSQEYSDRLRAHYQPLATKSAFNASTLEGQQESHFPELGETLAVEAFIGNRFMETTPIAEETLSGGETLHSPPSVCRHSLPANNDRFDIAIIGMSGIMPQAEDLDTFWQNLIAGQDVITEVPPDRWDWQAIYGDPSEGNKTTAKWGGFMPAVDKFDPLFFNISAREAELMDPQQRLFLETVWKTIEDAGYKAADLAETNTGIFVGMATCDYAELLKHSAAKIEAYTGTGTVFAILPNRVSYLLNLHGPSESLDTACSGALVAIHRAVEAIQSGACNLAIAGGVNVMITPTLTLSFSKAGMLSAEGRCKTFDKGANGYVRGEGVGAILLKPLAQAEADGDNIYAVIKCTAENHGGHANSLTAPNPNAQAQLLIDAYQKAHLDPRTISYIEAHGTGTPLGDPIEINGLKHAFAELYQQPGLTLPLEPHCGIGSVKTNIGHLEAAAGIASVFKVVLAMRHRLLPGNLHFTELNPYINLHQSPFYLVTANRPWTPLTTVDGQIVPRRAGVSSFGFGGSNAHIVLEEYLLPSSPSSANSPHLIILSAKHAERLLAQVKQMVKFLDRLAVTETPTISLTDLAYTLQVGREAMEERLALVVSSLDDLKEKLTQYYTQDNTDREGCYQGQVKLKKTKTEQLIAGEAGEAFLRVVIAQREWHKLAQLWVTGVEIDWNLLYPTSRPRRISLPTYPFAKERYWVTTHAADFNRHSEKLHPLLDKNVSTLREQQFASLWNGTEFYLADHILGNQRVLPGVAYLEMARVAGEIAGERKVQKLTNVVVARPLSVPKPTEVKIRLMPVQQQVHFEISTLDDQQQRLVHTQGNLVYETTPNLSPEPVFLDIAAIQARCPTVISRAEFYAVLDKWADADLKSSFRVVQELLRNDEEALSRLALPASRDRGREEFVLHPSLMDGAVQTAILGIFRDIPTVHVPFAMGEVEIRGELTQCSYAYATLVTEKQGTSSSFKKFNTYLLDHHGQVLVKIRDFVVREFQPRPSEVSATFLNLEGFGKLEEGLQVETKITKLTPPPSPSVPVLQDDLLAKLREDMLQMAAQIIKADPRNLVMEEDLYQYGFESISFTEFTNVLNDKYQLAITPAVFFEHSSLGAVSQFLWTEYRDVFRSYYQARTSAELPSLPSVMQKREDAKGVVSSPQGSDVVEVSQRFWVTSPVPTLAREVSQEAIAIIGMSGMMPQSENLEVFWQHLIAGDDLVTEVPPDRWNWQDYYGDPKREANKTKIKWGGFMPAVDRFDPLFFGISPREAEFMDPQQRLFLETVWHTIEDAGYRASDLAGTRTGLFVGIATNDYKELLRDQGLEVETHATTGNVHAIVANRVSYLLDLQGPSEAIDTACSSALVAIHRAVQAIWYEQCEMAIAGGVNVILSPSYTISLSKAGGMLSEDGRCKTFDQSANGYVRGEGVGAILLKPLARAEAEGDRIYGIIRGTAVNHGGHAASLTAPNPATQAQLLIRAYENANIDPSTLSYIETHGTGTPLGDPIEINGLLGAFAELYNKQGSVFPTEPHCGLGAVKTNIGHLETAAGIAGVLKVLLAMKHQTLPGLLHFKTLNPYIHLHNTPFYLVTNKQPWVTPAGLPRRAGISSFGFGGTNAHLILEEYTRPRIPTPVSSPQLVVLSARNPDRLMAAARQLIAFLDQVCGDPTMGSLTDIAYTLQVGREAMEERLALVAISIEDVKQRLTQYVQGESKIASCYTGNHSRASQAKANLLIEGKEGEEFVQAVIQERKLTKLAQLWVAGVEIDWQLLHRHSPRPQRLSLPTYPFARDRHWLPATSATAVLRVSSGVNQGLHPLLDRNESTLEEQCYQKNFDRDAFYLRDHVMNGQAILPGVVYLEMARAAGQLANKRVPVTRLINVIWAKPILVFKHPETVYISLSPESATRVDFEVTTGEEPRQLHAQGKLCYESSVPLVSAEVNIEAIKARCTEVKNRAECYRLFADVGFNYGPSFQTIQTLFYNQTEALSHLVLATPQEGNGFVLHPALMDGALQTVAGLPGQLTAGQLYLPFGLGEMMIATESLPDRCYAYITAVGHSADDGASQVRKFNIQLLTETGQVLVQMKDFSVRRVPVASTLSTPTSTLTTETLTPDEKELLDLLRQLAAGKLSVQEVKELL